MTLLLAAYISGFIAMGLVFGWHNDPSPDDILRGVLMCALWPLVSVFVLSAGLAAAVKGWRK